MASDLTELKIKHSYDSGEDSLLGDFYIPVLSCAKRYDRISGFFSSTSLAIAARGMEALIRRGGKMRLVTCPKLSKEDAEVISKFGSDANASLSANLISAISDIPDGFRRDHVAALGWMLDQGYLEIKIALVYSKNGGLVYDEKELANSIMHQKVGIIYDELFHGLSFSGSNNESASGWLDNIEEFKVFKNWEPEQLQYFEDDKKRFDEFWNDCKQGVKVVDIPDAVRDRIIQIGSDFSIDKISLKNYLKQSNSFNAAHIAYKERKEILKPYSYQYEAIRKWKDNGKALLLEMATGTGKTRTAIACLADQIKVSMTPLLVVIACPQGTLSMQWKKDIDSIDIPIASEIICDGTATNWRLDLKHEIGKLSIGRLRNLIIYTTHKTASSDDFIEIIKGTKPKIEKFLIGDEVHGMGAPKTRAALLDCYKYRLGLSATPSRWFDDYGSLLIEEYFGSNSYIFSLRDALDNINPGTGKPFLVNYKYYPCFIQLTDDELENYSKITKKIRNLRNIKSAEAEDRIDRLLFERAKIEKTASNKYEELEVLLKKIGRHHYS